MTKQIIACLDIKEGRVVKGIQFQGVKDMGAPLELVQKYKNQGIDELVMLDIAGRSITLDLVKQAKEILDQTPLTVGGGINSLDQAERLLQAGADQVSIASASVTRPDLINEIAEKLGSNHLTIALDVGFDKVESDYYIYTQGGKIRQSIKAFDWAEEVEKRGAGRLLITSISSDGAQSGFDLDFIQKACRRVNIPIIASGGAGKIQDFIDLFTQTDAQAGLAASIFHQDKVDVAQLKQRLKKEGII